MKRTSVLYNDQRIEGWICTPQEAHIETGVPLNHLQMRDAQDYALFVPDAPDQDAYYLGYVHWGRKVHFIPRSELDRCPRCEKEAIAKDDYICLTCRYG